MSRSAGPELAPPETLARSASQARSQHPRPEPLLPGDAVAPKPPNPPPLLPEDASAPKPPNQPPLLPEDAVAPRKRNCQ